MTAAPIYGFLVSDRLPLYLCNRWGQGVWKPEYRLHSLWIPCFILNPVGLGIFGAALQYHLHYMVLALGLFLATLTVVISAPITINYVVECFTNHATEVTSILNFYRMVFGLTVPFFITKWSTSVGGLGWVFGMMAFFSLLAFSLIGALMVKGPVIRKYLVGNFASTEEGTEIDQKHTDRIDAFE
jgi:hypothetical protein